MPRFTEWCPELEAALAEPFPREVIKVKEQGGTKIEFVPWHHYVRRLNDLVGPGWSMGEPVIAKTDPYEKWRKPRGNEPGQMVTMPGRFVIAVPVTILGVTRVNVGDESEGKDDYGTPSTNALAQAFKRTLALFGMGLEFYDKEARMRAMRSGNAPTPTQGTDAQKQDGYYATDGQKARIKSLLNERDVDMEKRQRIERALSNGFTSQEAAKTIVWLERRPMLVAREPGSDDE